MMKISRLGIFTLLLITVVLGANCNIYNRVMARKSLVDGAKAYGERKFEEAEEKFRAAVEYDPNLTTLEGRTAQLFLARTIHSEFAADRGQTDKAEDAIAQYQRALDGFVSELAEEREVANAKPEDEKAKNALKSTEDNIGSIVRSVASLYQNLKQDDKWNAWELAQAENEQMPNDVRAGAYVALASQEYDCANEITDSEEVKKTVKEDGKDVFKFSKPESEDDFDKLKECVEKGTEYIDKAVELNPESDSAWSYKANLIEQARRIAEMNGESERSDSLKEEFKKAKEKFEELAKKRLLAEEAEEKRKAEEKAKKEGKKPKAEVEEEPEAPADAAEKPAEAEEAPAEKDSEEDN